MTRNKGIFRGFGPDLMLLSMGVPLRAFSLIWVSTKWEKIRLHLLVLHLNQESDDQWLTQPKRVRMPIATSSAPDSVNLSTIHRRDQVAGHCECPEQHGNSCRRERGDTCAPRDALKEGLLSVHLDHRRRIGKRLSRSTPRSLANMCTSVAADKTRSHCSSAYFLPAAGCLP